MKRIDIDKLEKNMIIGEEIKDKNGNVLIRAGATLTSRIIEKLKNEGKKTLSILENGEVLKENEDEGSVGLNFLEGLKKKYGNLKNLNKKNSINTNTKEKKTENKSSIEGNLRQEKINEKRPIVIVKKDTRPKNKVDKKELDEFLKRVKLDLKSTILTIKNTGTIVQFKLSANALKIINSIIANDKVLLNLKKMQKHDPYLYNHAIYVALVSIVAAETIGLNKNDMFSIGLAGIMIDSGMVKVPQEIITKKAVLKPEERSIIEKHPSESYKTIAKLQIATELSKRIVLEHHERIDGTGYPKKRTGDKINECTRLLSIIDVYHALISDRPYHQKKTNKEAFFTIFMYRGKQFDGEILAKLIK